MFTLLMPFVLVPMVGLAIDATMLFSVKAKLQAAVDGGALAAAQSLSSGLTFTAQSAAATKTADEFIKANFVSNGSTPGPGGYWASYNLNDQTCDANGNPTPSGTNACIVAAQDTANKRTTVTIAASVTVPLIFMRILGFSNGTVTSKAQAARRDVVMVLVLDRSSSMTPTIAALQAGATLFTNGFQSTRDRLGLVVFGGSAIVAYPPGDWNNTSPTGPDTSFMTASPNMVTLIDDIAVGSNTGTAEALILAYKELLAANQPGALNVIVLFTDGQPNGITANFNGPNSAGQGSTSVKSTSTCSYKNDSGSNPSMLGWLAQWGGYVAGPDPSTGKYDYGHGIYALAQWSGTSVTSWLGNESEPVLASGSSQPGKGCYYASNQGNVYEDITIPAYDYYGNSTIGSNVGSYTYSDYQYSEIWSDTTECNNGHRIGGVPLTLTGNASGDSCQIGLASWNAADMAGKLIHSDTTFNPVIYCMGYEGNGGDDPVLMQRLANINVSTNTVYNSTKPSGKYIQIQNINDIAGAFASLAEEILRISM
jgi:Flp pilus assembly protein TadG